MQPGNLHRNILSSPALSGWAAVAVVKIIAGAVEAAGAVATAGAGAVIGANVGVFAHVSSPSIS